MPLAAAVAPAAIPAVIAVIPVVVIPPSALTPFLNPSVNNFVSNIKDPSDLHRITSQSK